MMLQDDIYITANNLFNETKLPKPQITPINDYTFIINGNYDDIRTIVTIMKIMIGDKYINLIDINDMFRIQAFQFQMQDNEEYVRKLRDLTFKHIDIETVVQSNILETRHKKINIILDVPEKKFYRFPKSIKILFIRNNDNNYYYNNYNHIGIVPDINSYVIKVLELLRIYCK